MKECAGLDCISLEAQNLADGRKKVDGWTGLDNGRFATLWAKGLEKRVDEI